MSRFNHQFMAISTSPCLVSSLLCYAANYVAYYIVIAYFLDGENSGVATG